MWNSHLNDIMTLGPEPFKNTPLLVFSYPVCVPEGTWASTSAVALCAHFTEEEMRSKRPSGFLPETPQPGSGLQARFSLLQSLCVCLAHLSARVSHCSSGEDRKPGSSPRDGGALG